MARTLNIPPDVLEYIKRVRDLGGYPSDAATLWAIVRMASPGIIAHQSGYRYESSTNPVPTRYEPSTNHVPTPSTYQVPGKYEPSTDVVPPADTNQVRTTYQSSTDEDDPTLAAMAAIDFDID